MRVYRVIYLLIAMSLASCTSAPNQPASDAALPDCGTFPNCVSSSSTEGTQAVAPIAATAQQWLELKTWIAAQDDWTITIDNGDFMQAVVKTPLMRFRDDVQLRFDQNTGVIQVRSSSRLGISDMGANRSRVEMLRDQLSP
ncbi:DUF1499 domain-containing protein [Halioglobus maricola]|uniref:DUF1499 domain-containing protein n=1 Tax=Halioglobus maricola TaxID=2601894 RepID=A0A5P9NF23_9GAMM|nr:DUF1499 domain-containing protein [Halioglobus maricola]QFU74367.1 DUF1499 domain-containing protein [Halioglobus maricola]